ncbi:GntR family transcriptional regulator [Bordetella genomosp. 9]|uniref:GntR family transcriptional regulator n=1 Tax=Bordetella genomosp. 9 TaxID=1416803 RepID=A0A261R1X2_9BORD|nr:GntR family transcriptional regulator [Bordetella genomosp. 9]OZI18620.1 GntR family transcriptional regulator [Bordetella genomosp. 9]
MPVSALQAARPAAARSDVSSGDDAYARIRRDVLSCRLAPGAFVTEPELMQAYGIRKTSCRIALVRLAQEGFVRSKPRKGYQISPITLRDVEEVFTLRVQVEPLAARLAAGRVDVEQLRRLEAACRVQHPVLQLSDQIDAFMDANKAFHLAIAAACGNDRLYKLLSQLMDEMSRLVALGFGVQRTKPEIKHDHNAMIDALAEGDGKRAETIARRHIETFQVMTLEKLYASLTQTGAIIPVPAGLNGSGR